jgi:hypothetical protein
MLAVREHARRAVLRLRKAQLLRDLGRAFWLDGSVPVTFAANALSTDRNEVPVGFGTHPKDPRSET